MAGPIYILSDLPRGPVSRNKWTAIIPAAGQGSRLGYNRPKILYPILGRPMLDWVLDALEPVCSRFVLALSPAGKPLVEPIAYARLGGRLDIAVQDVPTGMGDAVRLATDATRTDYALVVWGDQVTLRKETIQVCAALHETRPQATLTIPTIIKRNPYIDLERDAYGRIVRVRQAREGEILRDVGENDCGLFLFSSTALFATLDRVFGARQGHGKHTGETNLLQVLPAFECGPGSVATVRIADADETLGVNTSEDAAAIAKILTARQASDLNHDHVRTPGGSAT